MSAVTGRPMDIYKVPRNSVNVEALAQGLARYLQMTAEDTEVLSKDPTRRDQLIAELYKNSNMAPTCYPSQFVAPGQDPDVHLIPADAEIAKLTPPKSFEDRVSRLHLAFAAMLVYQQFKVIYALRDHPDLERRVHIRRREIMDKWRRDVFDPKFPPRPQLGYGNSRKHSTPRTQASLPTPPPSSHSPKQVSNDEALDFLGNPHTMIGKQFVHTPPQGADQEDSGTWEVISYTVKKGDGGGVDHEYQVHLPAFGTDHVPMGREEVHYLLQYSTVAI